MHKLIDYVCDELEELEKKADKGDLSMTEIQYADTLAHLKKNLLKGEEMYDEMMGESEYSNAMRDMRDGRMYRSNRGDMSRARGYSRVRRDAMGRYSRDGGYSYADSMDELMEEMRGMMGEMPEEKRREVQRFIDKMERM